MTTLGAQLRLLCLVALAATAYARPAFGQGLSDLEMFTKSSQELEQIFNNVSRRQTYRKALESYATPSDKVARQFEATMEQLRKMRSQVSGLNERLLTPRKPMAFQYSSPSKPTFRFERVIRPFHSIWLLGGLQEKDSNVCSPRDSLLVDRWTPVLKDANLFAVEKDGKYTGTTLTLVPVKASSKTYLLVSPNDHGAPIPAPLLEAFLRDYRKREPGTLPFALLTKTAGAYQIDKIDAQGRKAGRLGPIEGFQLADPMARKIVASVPAWCTRSTQTALNGSSSMGMETSERNPASVTPATSPAPVNNFSLQANATVNNPSGEKPNQYLPVAKNIQSGANRDLQQGGGGLGRDDRRDRQSGNRTTIIATVNAPPSVAFGGKANSNAGSSSNLNVPITNNQAPAPMPSPVPMRDPASLNDGAGMGGGRVSNAPAASAGASPAYRKPISAADQKILDAIGEGRKAREDGRPVPPAVVADLAEGAAQAQDPAIRSEAKDDFAKAYFDSENAEQAHKALKKIGGKSDEVAEKAVSQLNSQICDRCPDCEYCVRLKNRVQGGAQ